MPFNNTVRQPLPDSPLQSRPTGNHYLRSLTLNLENPLGVIVILALGLSGTLLIVVSRHSCSGTILTIVERGAVATLHQDAGPFRHPDNLITRQSGGGTILAVVERGVVATHHQGAGPFWHPDNHHH